MGPLTKWCFWPALRHYCWAGYMPKRLGVVMDCDLQDRSGEIPRLYYAKGQEGYDIAQRGARCDPLLKHIISWLFYKICSYLAEIEYDGESGTFRVMFARWW